MSETRNQCDGCCRGLPVDGAGIHHGPGEWDAMLCTADRYRPDPRDHDEHAALEEFRRACGDDD